MLLAMLWCIAVVSRLNFDVDVSVLLNWWLNVQVANAFGRMGVGVLSHRYKDSISLPIWSAVGSLLMAVGCALLMVPSLIALYFVCAICGVAYGMFWTLAPTLAAEISGLKHLGANYAFLW